MDLFVVVIVMVIMLLGDVITPGGCRDRTSHLMLRGHGVRPEMRHEEKPEQHYEPRQPTWRQPGSTHREHDQLQNVTFLRMFGRCKTPVHTDLPGS
ncbi:hypothetical protein [Nonomuraea dietziae]|uniref:hypothetical protein n=1 Tax=Nonomuraea dietziae TaxID=65515 RepID=UPI00340923DD